MLAEWIGGVKFFSWEAESRCLLICKISFEQAVKNCRVYSLVRRFCGYNSPDLITNYANSD
jgi:hypothetical protein